jgi:two-component system cell cycle response regulator DivK
MSQRILVVEDTDDNRRILRDLLVSAGFDLAEATDGISGLEMAQAFRPHLIVMDIQLPRLDGYGLARRLRADPSFRDVPLVAVTSYALRGDEEKAKAAGCNAYVTKPFSPRQLLATIRGLLDTPGHA